MKSNTINNIFRYFVGSNLTIAFNLNPLRWGFILEHYGPDEESETHFWYIKFLCFVIMIIISNEEL
jgi:hypothetical protein